MSDSLNVFVSSACYELRDLRAALKSWLEAFGVNPQMSDENGFPNFDGMPPYASCLRVLEDCPLVICVIGRSYGHKFDDWGPYSMHIGRSPTHAELMHAIQKKKRVLLYVDQEVWTFYEAWRRNNEAFEKKLPPGLDVATLKLFAELKSLDVVPWIYRFGNVTDVLKSLKEQFVNEICQHFKARELAAMDTETYLLNRVLEFAPEARAKIVSGLNSNLQAEQQLLQEQLTKVLSDLINLKESTQAEVEALMREKKEIQDKLDSVTLELHYALLELAREELKLGHSSGSDLALMADYNAIADTYIPKTATAAPRSIGYSYNRASDTTVASTKLDSKSNP